MKIEIVSKVNIEITQEDLEEMVIAKIRKANSDINVDKIEFIQRRNPNRIVVEVDAYLGDKPTEKQEELGLEEPAPTEEGESSDDTAPEDLGDVFG